jgi:hypothetical protein
MKFYPHFQHFYPIYEAIATTDVLLNTCWDSSDRYRDCRTLQQLQSSDICSCTMKPWDISKTKDSAMDSMYWVTEYTIFRCIRKNAKSDYWLCHVCLSVRLSAWKTRLPLEGFSWNLTIEYFSKFCRENSSFNKIKTWIRSTLHDDQ